MGETFKSFGVFILVSLIFLTITAWVAPPEDVVPPIDGDRFITKTVSQAAPIHQPVTVTFFHAVAGETDGTPCITADNTNLCTSTVTICSVSPDLLKAFPFGTTVRIEILGGIFVAECEIHDTTNSRLKRTVDIYLKAGRGGRFAGTMTKKE